MQNIFRFAEKLTLLIMKLLGSPDKVEDLKNASHKNDSHRAGPGLSRCRICRRNAATSGSLDRRLCAGPSLWLGRPRRSRDLPVQPGERIGTADRRLTTFHAASRMRLGRTGRPRRLQVPIRVGL